MMSDSEAVDCLGAEVEEEAEGVGSERESESKSSSVVEQRVTPDPKDSLAAI